MPRAPFPPDAQAAQIRYCTVLRIVPVPGGANLHCVTDESCLLRIQRSASSPASARVACSTVLAISSVLPFNQTKASISEITHSDGYAASQKAISFNR
jgi:hypothetical protein